MIIGAAALSYSKGSECRGSVVELSLTCQQIQLLENLLTPCVLFTQFKTLAIACWFEKILQTQQCCLLCSRPNSALDTHNFFHNTLHTYICTYIKFHFAKYRVESQDAEPVCNLIILQNFSFLIASILPELTSLQLSREVRVPPILFLQSTDNVFLQQCDSIKKCRTCHVCNYHHTNNILTTDNMQRGAISLMPKFSLLCKRQKWCKKIYSPVVGKHQPNGTSALHCDCHGGTM